jgi:hypothetical protein
MGVLFEHCTEAQCAGERQFQLQNRSEELIQIFTFISDYKKREAEEPQRSEWFKIITL